VEKSKILIGIIILAAIIVGGIVGYLLLRPKYELSYNYMPGEIYVYESKTTTEYLGYKIGTTTGKDRVEILNVSSDEIFLCHNLTQSVLISQAVQNKTFESKPIVYTEVISPKGKTKYVTMGQKNQTVEQSKLAQPTYPAKPMSIAIGPFGGRWVTPIKQEIKQAGSTIRLTGEIKNKLVSKEKIKTLAGEFDCLKITFQLSLLEEFNFKNQILSINRADEGVIWVDLKSGTQVKGEVQQEIKGMGETSAHHTTTQLIEYVPP
jgi:hypothetical protein